MNSVAVIGAGAWGAALAIQAHRAGNAVRLWARDAGRARARMGAHGADITLIDHLPATADLILLAVPCQHLRGVITGWHLPAPTLICAKGVEAGTGRLPIEICAEADPAAPIGVLSGPNFAHEVAAGLPAAAVLAIGDDGLRARLPGRLATPAFRIYGSADPVGAQLGGAAKNVIAIAAGAVIGAGLGENARAALITRGIAELARLAIGLGGRAETVSGLSGLGDLLLTCTSAASRNTALGMRLGAGDTLAAALAAGTGVTEGVATAPALVARAGAHGIDLPICEAVADFVAGSADLRHLVQALMNRPLREE